MSDSEIYYVGDKAEFIATLIDPDGNPVGPDPSIPVVATVILPDKTPLSFSGAYVTQYGVGVYSILVNLTQVGVYRCSFYTPTGIGQFSALDTLAVRANPGYTP